MSDQVIVRAARQGDADSLAYRWVEFGQYYASRDPARFRVPEIEGLARWFESRIEEPHELWLVAERSGAIVGFLEARVWPALPWA